VTFYRIWLSWEAELRNIFREAVQATWRTLAVKIAQILRGRWEWDLAGQKCAGLGGRHAGHVCVVSRMSEVSGSWWIVQENCAIFRRSNRPLVGVLTDRTAQFLERLQ